MKYIILYSACLLLFITSTHAQDDEQAKVLHVVNQLFEGMRLGDSTMVHDTFHKEPTLFTTMTNREGQPVLHQGRLQDFLNAIGTPHDVVWHEPIWDTEVRVDGNLAQVWTKYAFYAGEQFSHCGVDAFQLFKSLEGWKIFHLTDTRQFSGCEVPEEVTAKYGNIK